MVGFLFFACYLICCSIQLTLLCKSAITDPGFVTLSIDDGPTAQTERILEILTAKRARAIFFMTGENITKRPETIRRLAEAGHVIGNHTYTHVSMTELNLAGQRDEFERTSRLIADITGTPPPYFRPPYGAFNETTLLIAREANTKVVMWSAVSLTGSERKTWK